MKKLLTLVCAFTMLASLTACGGNKNTVISNGNETLVTVGNTKITKESIYNSMKPSSGSTALLGIVEEKLYELEGISLTEEMKQKASDEYDALVADYDNDEEAFFSVLAMYYGANVSSKEEYLEKLEYPVLLNNALIKKYVLDESETLFETYKPRKAIIIQCENEANAKKALAAMKENKDASEIAKEFGLKDSTYTGAETIYVSESSVAATAYSKLIEASNPGVIDEVISDTTTSTDSETNKEVSTTYYYVVKAIDVDPNNFKDEAAETIVNTVASVQTSMMEYYLKKHNFKIYDLDLYDEIKDTYPTYLTQTREN